MTVKQLALLVLDALENADLRELEALALSVLEEGPATDVHSRRRRCCSCGVEGWPGELESHLHERRAA